MRKDLGTLLCLAALGACSGTRPRLDVQTSQAGPNTRLTLLTAPGLRLNARLKPALELPDGRVLRFDSPHLTSDSAYFAEPPGALLSGRHRRVHGTLRASVCDSGTTVCRVLEVIM
jgi:hypothetical protein